MAKRRRPGRPPRGLLPSEIFFGHLSQSRRLEKELGKTLRGQKAPPKNWDYGKPYGQHGLARKGMPAHIIIDRMLKNPQQREKAEAIVESHLRHMITLRLLSYFSKYPHTQETSFKRVYNEAFDYHWISFRDYVNEVGIQKAGKTYWKFLVLRIFLPHQGPN